MSNYWCTYNVFYYLLIFILKNIDNEKKKVLSPTIIKSKPYQS